MRRRQDSYRATSASISRFLQAFAATFAVIGIPILAVSALRASGTVTSLIPLVAAGVALSVAASYLGAAVWATGKGSGDVLFADLMLWGLVRRWWAERQFSRAARLLGLRESAGDPPARLSASKQARLLKQLAATLEARCPDTHGHSRRVARHAAAIAKRMGLPGEEVARIRTAATVHDIGKIDIPAAIIKKPGDLTAAEFAAIKEHPGIGARMVAGLGDEELTRIVRNHHERLDGKGYPDGFAGAQIPLGARIIAVADTFDAITSTRSYRPARRHKEALELLAAEAGTQLDPEAVRAFRRYYSGHRPVAAWALLLNGPRHLIASLTGQAKLAGAVTAATLATAAAGTVAIPAPEAGERSSGQTPDTVATRLVTFSGRSDAAGSKAGLASLPSSRFGDGGDGGVRGDGAPVSAGPSGETGPRPSGEAGPRPSGEAGARPDDTPSTGRSGSVPGDGRSRDESLSDAGSGGGGGPSDGEGGSTDRVVSTVTAPVDSTVGTVVRTVDTVVRTVDTVVRTVESPLPGVEVPILRDVRSVLPRLGG
jgi:putative nucleotidyltransferase with HDIG domain